MYVGEWGTRGRWQVVKGVPIGSIIQTGNEWGEKGARIGGGSGKFNPH